MRHINECGIEIIKSFEGFSSEPYLCPDDVWTVVYCVTRGWDGRPVDPDIGSIKFMQKICLVVTLKLPKGGLLGLLKRRFQKISFPL